MDSILRHVSRKRWALWLALGWVLPQAAWAPDSRVDLGLTTVELKFQVLYFSEDIREASIKYGGIDSFSIAKAERITNALNEKLKARGIRFEYSINEVFDPNAYKFGKTTSRKTILKRLGRYSKSGTVTVVVPYEVPTAAAYSRQYLADGPLAVIPKEAESKVVAEQIGYIFGFTKNCLSTENIMYRACNHNEESPEDELESDATYFTKDKVALHYPGLLGEWKRNARMHQMHRKLARAKKDKLLSWRQALPSNSPQTTRPYLPQTP